MKLKKIPASISDYFTIANLSKQTDERNLSITARFLETEEALAKQGLLLEEELQYSVMDYRRSLARDRLVEEHNKLPNVPQLKTSDQIEYDVFNSQTGGMLTTIDFDSSLIKKTIGSVGAGLYRDAVDHPALFAFTLAASTTAPFVIPTIIEGTVASMATLAAVEGTINALSNIPHIQEAREESSLRGFDKPNYVTELAKQFTIGAATSGLFSKAATINNRAISLATLALGEGTILSAASLMDTMRSREIASLTNQPQPNYLEEAGRSFVAGASIAALRSGTPKLISQIRKMQKTPEERANIRSSLNKEAPTSKLSLESNIKLRKDLAEFAVAVAENDKDKIINILNKKNWQPKKTKRKKTIAIDNQFLDIKDLGDTLNETTRNISINGRTDDTRSISTIIAELGAEYHKTKDQQQIKEIIKTILPEFSENITEKSPITSQTKSSLSKSISEFLEGETPPQTDLYKIITGDVSIEQIKSLTPERQSSALEIRRIVNQYQQSRIIASAAKSAITDYVKTYRHIRNTTNSLLEQATHKHKNNSLKLYTDIASIVTKAKKNKLINADKLDMAQLANAMLGSESKAGNVEQAVARRIKQYLREQNTEAVKLGIDIPRETNYLPNMWDSKQFYATTSAQFVEDMLNLADLEKMSAIATSRGRPIKNWEKFFTDTFYNIRHQLPARTVKKTSGDIIKTGDRIIQFKDGESWIIAHEKYGKKISPIELISTIATSQEKILSQGTLGLLSPTEVKEFTRLLFQELQTMAGKLSDKSKLEQTITKLKTGRKEFEKVFLDVSGFGESEYVPHPIISTGVSLKTKAMIGMAAGSAFFLDTFGAKAVLHATIGVKNSVFQILKTALRRATKEELEEIFAINHSLNKHAFNMMQDLIPSRLARTAYTIPERILGGVSSYSERRSGLVYGVQLAKELKKPQISTKMSKFLGKHGITKKDIQTIKSLPTTTIGTDTEIFSAHYLAKNGFISQQSNLYRKLAAAEHTAISIGSPKSSIFGKLAKIKSGDNLASYLVSSMAMPFYNITSTIMNVTVAEVEEMLLRKQIGDVAFVTAMTILGGYLAFTSKELLKGNKIDLTSKKTILSSMMYANVFGANADYILDGILGYSNDNNIISIITDIMTKKNKFNTMRKTALMFNPYKNVGVVGQLIDKYTTDQLFRLLDPDGAMSYDNFLYNQLTDDKIYEWKYNLLQMNN